MARRRRSYKRRSYKIQKYSNETMAGQTLVEVPYNNAPEDYQYVSANCILVANVTAQGMRKAKNFSLNISTNSPVPLVFAVIYKPQGFAVNGLSMSGTEQIISFYEPNQNVIMSGLVSSNPGQQTFRTRLARNLNSGDEIGIAIRASTHLDEDAANPNQTPNKSFNVTFTFNYAISF